ncbi:MAG TPA: protoporphyrinogen oxidase [Candidatus Acidoferrales bacterium]|nr:protoporphyrinogen oxidase [Candidatus Acidoferrales bacterium]
MAESGQVVVVGGGISGLACAVRLEQLGVPVRLLEASERVGGLLDTVEKDGFLFESGPQSFQGTELLLSLIGALGIDAELCKADPRAPRYVLRRGRLQKIPMSPQAVLGTSLLGVRTRWKVVSEAFRKTKPPSEEESISAFVRRKFGHEILEYLVSPFVSGVYAGDPERLSLRAAFPTLDEWEREYGSVLRGAIKSRNAPSAPPLCSFRRGMVTLTRAMAARLGRAVETSTGVDSIRKANGSSGGRWEVRCSGRDGAATLHAQAVVMAVPAHVAGRLIAPIAPDLTQKLSSIAYASLAVVGTGYYAKQAGAPLHGFGVLVPRSEKYRTLGIVWNTSLFAGRAPDGQMTITSFIGGATDPEIAQKPAEEITAIVQKDHEKILGITGSPITSMIWVHPKALPQYNLGHGHVVQAIRVAERSVAGLYFVGNYLEGPSIGKCVERGFQAAENVNSYRQTGVAAQAG